MSYRSRSYPPGPSCENNEGQWAGAIKRGRKGLKGRYILVPSDPPASAALGRRSARRDGLAIVEIAWVLEHQPQQVLAARFDLISRLVESAVAKAGGVLLTQKVTVSATVAANLAHPYIPRPVRL
jgi:hypothetical protein